MASTKSQSKYRQILVSWRKGQQWIAGSCVIILLLLLPGPMRSVTSTPIPDQVPLKTESKLSIPTNEYAPIPRFVGTEAAPKITAQAAYIYDPDSNIALFERQSDSQLMPASTTKIMTAVVALETYDLDQVITITEEERSIGNTMRLNRGEQLSVGDLLSGVLISSGNDAALALALAYPETGYSGFVAAMNQKAKDLGLTNTSFRNVSGVESLNHYVSARDLAILTKYALQQPTIKKLVGQQTAVVKSLDGKYQHQLVSTNQLLGSVEGVYGVKTGWTENAGECLVTAVERQGHELIIVILGSQDRFGETQALIEWAYQNHLWQDIFEAY